jgi:xylulokinase
MARAVMEGVVFASADGLDLMRSLGTRVERVVASGGAARHPLWLQLQADIFNLDVVRSESAEAAALGAALMAGVAAGIYPDLGAACAVAVTLAGEPVRPDPAGAEKYARLRESYRALYPALKGLRP